ncbi:MAG: hypothetical protein IJU29_06305 [Oscillospiraceae bacterium]|nr:hypothetical protein [Oscillospiraceae bacterium]
MKKATTEATVDRETRRAAAAPSAPPPAGADCAPAAMPEESPRSSLASGGSKPIGQAELARAREIFESYRRGRANFEKRIVEDELWWELRHWELTDREGRSRRGTCSSCAPGAASGGTEPPPASAWLFNAILNKHADAMDNYPEPAVLPRERSDEGSARILSSVLPVVLEQNRFEETYADAWWEKLKHGTAAYGVFWNSEKLNGLGDIDIVGLDLLNLFWEPGITDLQKSANLFITELRDTGELEARYPQYAGRLGGGTDVKEYLYDDTVDNSGKAVVTDWYYRRATPSGRTVLHYAKFCGDCLLYASENEEAYRERGYYDHGMYPVVLDVLFPEKGTPAGFGYVAICKDPQRFIDSLSANIRETAMMNTRRRFFVSTSTGINEEEFLDWSGRPLVHVEGDLGDARVREISPAPLSGVYLDVMRMKVEEMKDTASNRDVNSGGGAGNGVTAAAAIAALQEAGNKTSRDMIAASYRAHTRVTELCIELMRQFYDFSRAFRVTGKDGDFSFVRFSNELIRDREAGVDADGETLYRRPVFDLKIRAQRSNPFSRMERNARAQELYGAGFFRPENAQASLIALEMMDFEGIDAVRDQVRQGQTLANQLEQAQKELEQARREAQAARQEARRASQELAMTRQRMARAGMAPGPSVSGPVGQAAPMGAARPGGMGPSGPSGAARGSDPGSAPGPGPASRSPAQPYLPVAFAKAHSRAFPASTGSIMGSGVRRTGYQQRLAERSRPRLG